MTLPAAVLAMIEAALPGVTVYDGRVPSGAQEETPPERYVAFYPDIGTRSAADLVCAQPTSATFRWQVTSVGPDRETAAWLAEQVVDALAGQRPTADDWDPGLIEHTFSQLPRPDERVQGRKVLVAIDQYQLLAERLPTP